ncbi:MAG: LmbE family N-acetylglucosaminyl deacetylase, partial [Myxococcota bacterium]
MSTLISNIVIVALFNTMPTAPPPTGSSSAELLRRIQHMQVVGSVLYVAAHPDDENTRLLTYLSKGMGLNTAYLSMTRGDGGQNRIGTEQAELLGVIRTHELLRARDLDGARQRFTRAQDFGYSKTPDETLALWGHQAILGDVVGAIRRFRPDVIITRFNDKGRNHGHHTASAILAAEAFSAAADPKQFQEHKGAWQANRLLRNVSHWRLPKNADMSAFLKLDVGGYDPLLGVSYGELAGAARSMHKSQGFGAERDRAQIHEYFERKAGSRAKGDVFEGIDLSWSRLKGGQAVA